MISIDTQYKLTDRYNRSEGRIFLTGTQALVRIMIDQARLDEAAGKNTAGFVSGYRGSPLGGVDQEMWRAEKLLTSHKVKFLPAINEDLAATAVLGTQQVESDPEREVEGVFSMWYGKGPGVDRAGDALKHGNAYGSSPTGGALVVTGDDHGCVSSSMAHQSDVALMSWFMPVLNPASIDEIISYGLYGYALSRYSGMWVGLKAIAENIESAASIELSPLPKFNNPGDFDIPELGLHYRWPDLPGPQIENRMVAKKDAVLAFARANPIDKCLYHNGHAKLGIITTGKGHKDLMEAMHLLDLNEGKCRQLGIDIYKIGMVWPLEMKGISSFMAGKKEILVVEEKRGIIESQIKEYAFSNNTVPHPNIFGKENEDSSDLLSWTGELNPRDVAAALSYRLKKAFGIDLSAAIIKADSTIAQQKPITDVIRMPYFCSGCPHNRSTKVPEGSKALAGIGCHFMASWMERETSSLIQMGGEGVNWVGRSLFNGNKHIFQNLGEGTYFHSGSMAIRQAQAAGANITYKILFNDAVAMTGGQPVDGQITVPGIAAQVRAEGVEAIVIVTDEPETYRTVSLPKSVEVHDRDMLDSLQKDLRQIKGVSVLIYDQTCAAEKRRRRKRGTYPDPTKRAFINHRICEGCGDCSVQSNCLSIVPRETMAGRKRQIDQHSCNKDFSCIEGFCPSFVTIEGGSLKKPEATQITGLKDAILRLPEPVLPTFNHSYDLLVSGVGGTGVITIGAIITMAAHLEGKGASVLDFMGFAQKGGTVLSYIRFAPTPNELNQVRIETGRADAAIACDMVVATGPAALRALAKDRTRIALNMEEIPTGNYVLDRDADMHVNDRTKLLADIVGRERFDALNATRLAVELLGDSVFSNMMMTGYAWQQGLIPASLAALMQALTLNGVAVEKNKIAFGWGRLMAHDPKYVLSHCTSGEPKIDDSLSGLMGFHRETLTNYGGAAYTVRYRKLIDKVIKAEANVLQDSTALSEAVARSYFKLLAIKDEYEVARLITDGDFKDEIAKRFTGKFKVKYHMAPPIFGGKKGPDGRPRKYAFGGWVIPLLKLMCRMRFLRGSKLDIFSYSKERRAQLALLENFESMTESIIQELSPDNLGQAVDLVASVMKLRGFGPVFEQSLEEYQKSLPALKDAFYKGGQEAT